METKKKKRSFKKTMKRALRKVIEFFVNCKNKFMSLPSKMRYVIYVWAAVLLVILILIIGSSLSTKKLNKYHTFEQALTAASKDYVVKNSITPNVGKKLRVDLDMLIDSKYIKAEDVTDKTCRGYSIVYYNEDTKDYVINSYLNCKHYTTKDFAFDYEQ